MLYRLLADLVLVAHLLFIVFAVFGGLLALRWPRVAIAHLPAVAWAGLLELFGWFCPLTPLENTLRRAGGAAGYHGGFIEHYLLPLIYPAGLTREVQLVLGSLIIGFNLAVYAFVLHRRRRRRSATPAEPA